MEQGKKHHTVAEASLHAWYRNGAYGRLIRAVSDIENAANFYPEIDMQALHDELYKVVLNVVKIRDTNKLETQTRMRTMCKGKGSK